MTKASLGPAHERLLGEVPPPKVDGQRRMLSLDGGGVRGILTLEVLRGIERELAAVHGRDDLVLADYFDYFAGTSTGCVIASGLALGKSVQQLIDMYLHDLIGLIEPIPVWQWAANAFRHRFPPESMTGALHSHYGSETLFGDTSMRSLLLAVLHNASTDSPWPLSNNPHAAFNDPSSADCNSLIPLWKVIRASAAAPFSYPPERVEVGGQTFVFVDGALTPYNNPAFQLFLMATQPAYRLNWPTGTDRLLLVSVGTGVSANERPHLARREVGLRHHATTLVGTLMRGASAQQDIACRSVGHCTFGGEIDAELGDLRGGAPAEKEFTYVRYNASFTEAGVRRLGLDHLANQKQLKQLRQIARADNISTLREIGRAMAERDVDLHHFGPFTGVEER